KDVCGCMYIDMINTNKNDTSHECQRRAQAQDGYKLPILDRPDIMDIVRSSQSTLQNINSLVLRLDRIIGTIENGQGSIGKLISDPGLYNRLNATLQQVQGMVNDISSGKGSVGKLIYSDDLYNRLNGSIDKLNKIVDDINAGQGTVGMLLKETRTLLKAIRENPKKYLTIHFKIF